MNVENSRLGSLFEEIIYVYVKNKQAGLGEGAPPVAGVLLYAGTSHDYEVDQDYVMGGNLIALKTLDLAQEFSGIKRQLEDLLNYLPASDK